MIFWSTTLAWLNHNCELFSGPYTAEEHAKCALVVREARLNRAYPDEGRKKQAHAPKDGDTREPITVVPLCAVGTADLGIASCARIDAAGRPSKRATPGAPEQVEIARSTGLSSAVGGLSHALGSAARTTTLRGVAG